MPEPDGSANRKLGQTRRRPGNLDVQRTAHDGRVTLILTGELDLASRPLLDEELQTIGGEAPEAILLDLAEVSFMDSTGLHGILAAQVQCAGRGCELQLLRCSEPVRRLLELTGAIDQLPCPGPSETQAGA
jgi:anti-sigma B factor antagonist